jgi:hypothetical protein
MNISHSEDMILAYDVRHDPSYERMFKPMIHERWQAYLRGELAVSITEGHICEVYQDPISGDPYFALDAWTRHFRPQPCDKTRYAVGQQVMIESVTFNCRAMIVDGLEAHVTRIWIGNKVQPNTARGCVKTSVSLKD